MLDRFSLWGTAYQTTNDPSSFSSSWSRVPHIEVYQGFSLIIRKLSFQVFDRAVVVVNFWVNKQRRKLQLVVHRGILATDKLKGWRQTVAWRMAEQLYGTAESKVRWGMRDRYPLSNHSWAWEHERWAVSDNWQTTHLCQHATPTWQNCYYFFSFARPVNSKSFTGD